MRDFIYGSLTADYERTEFRKVFDKPPTAVFYDEGGNVLEEVLLEEMKRWLTSSISLNYSTIISGWTSSSYWIHVEY